MAPSFVANNFNKNHQTVTSQFRLTENSVDESWSTFSSLVFNHSTAELNRTSSFRATSITLSTNPISLRAQILSSALNSRAFHVNSRRIENRPSESNAVRTAEKFHDEVSECLEFSNLSTSDLGENDIEIPSLDELEETLNFVPNSQDSQQITASNAEKLSILTAEQLVIARSVTVLHANLLNQLLTSSISFPRHINYLRSIEESDLWTLYYLLHSLPSRIYGAVVRGIEQATREKDFSNDASFLSRFVRILGRSWNLFWNGIPTVIHKRITKKRKDSQQNSDKSIVSPQLSDSDLSFYERTAAIQRLLTTGNRKSMNLGSLQSLKPKTKLLKDLFNPLNSLTTLQISMPSLFEQSKREVTIKRVKLERMRMLVTLGLGLHAKVDFKSTSISIDNKRELNIVLLNDLDFMYTSLVTIKSIAIHDCLMNEEFFFQAVKTLETPVVNNPDQTEPTFETLHSKALTVLQELRALKSELSKLKSIHGAPHYILRNWIPIATTLILANRAASQFYFSFEVYQIWARELYLGAQAFLEEWIWKPMKGIWETVRHKETKLALMGAESLNSDLESLERMVVSFAKDHGVVDDAGIREIISKTQVGDLTIVLQEYEKQMRSPISNVIRGDLLRALLIQIQKAKVDGELAVSALDKLLRSNELNFAVLALFPSLAFVYFTYSWAIRTWNGRQYLNESIPLVRNSLRDISRLLNYAQTQDSDQTLGPYLHGLLLSELQLLQQHAKTAFGNQYQLKSHFFMDVSDLESEKLSIRQKLGVIERMSRSYPRLVIEF